MSCVLNIPSIIQNDARVFRSKKNKVIHNINVQRTKFKHVFTPLSHNQMSEFTLVVLMTFEDNGGVGWGVWLVSDGIHSIVNPSFT